MLCTKISTSWKKLAPTGRHGRHVFATLALQWQCSVATVAMQCGHCGAPSRAPSKGEWRQLWHIVTILSRNHHHNHHRYHHFIIVTIITIAAKCKKWIKKSSLICLFTFGDKPKRRSLCPRHRCLSLLSLDTYYTLCFTIIIRIVISHYPQSDMTL